MEKQSCQLITERLVLRAWLESDAGYCMNMRGIRQDYIIILFDIGFSSGFKSIDLKYCTCSSQAADVENSI